MTKKPELSEDGREAPCTALETTVAAIFSELLRVDPVSVSENFFSLGGNSLIAAKVVSHVLTELGVRLPLWMIFEFATVHELAEQIERLSKLESKALPE